MNEANDNENAILTFAESKINNGNSSPAQNALFQSLLMENVFTNVSNTELVDEVNKLQEKNEEAMFQYKPIEANDELVYKDNKLKENIDVQEKNEDAMLQYKPTKPNDEPVYKTNKFKEANDQLLYIDNKLKETTKSKEPMVQDKPTETNGKPVYKENKLKGKIDEPVCKGDKLEETNKESMVQNKPTDANEKPVYQDKKFEEANDALVYIDNKVKETNKESKLQDKTTEANNKRVHKDDKFKETNDELVYIDDKLKETNDEPVFSNDKLKKLNAEPMNQDKANDELVYSVSKLRETNYDGPVYKDSNLNETVDESNNDSVDPDNKQKETNDEPAKQDYKPIEKNKVPMDQVNKLREINNSLAKKNNKSEGINNDSIDKDNKPKQVLKNLESRLTAFKEICDIIQPDILQMDRKKKAKDDPMTINRKSISCSVSKEIVSDVVSNFKTKTNVIEKSMNTLIVGISSGNSESHLQLRNVKSLEMDNNETANALIHQRNALIDGEDSQKAFHLLNNVNLTSKGVSKSNEAVPIASKEKPMLIKEIQISSKEVPIAKEEFPVSSKETLISSKAILIADKEVPISSKEVPAGSKDVPCKKVPATSISKEVSMSSKEIPILPISSKTILIRDKEIPITNTEVSMLSMEIPAIRKEVSISCKEIPNKSKEILLSIPETPIANTEIPITNKGIAIAGREMLVADKEVPKANKEVPISILSNTTYSQNISHTASALISNVMPANTSLPKTIESVDMATLIRQEMMKLLPQMLKDMQASNPDTPSEKRKPVESLPITSDYQKQFVLSGSQPSDAQNPIIQTRVESRSSTVNQELVQKSSLNKTVGNVMHNLKAEHNKKATKRLKDYKYIDYRGNKQKQLTQKQTPRMECNPISFITPAIQPIAPSAASTTSPIYLISKTHLDSIYSGATPRKVVAGVRSSRGTSFIPISLANQAQNFISTQPKPSFNIITNDNHVAPNAKRKNAAATKNYSQLICSTKSTEVHPKLQFSSLIQTQSPLPAADTLANNHQKLLDNSVTQKGIPHSFKVLPPSSYVHAAVQTNEVLDQTKKIGTGYVTQQNLLAGNGKLPFEFNEILEREIHGGQGWYKVEWKMCSWEQEKQLISSEYSDKLCSFLKRTVKDKFKRDIQESRCSKSIETNLTPQNSLNLIKQSIKKLKKMQTSIKENEKKASQCKINKTEPKLNKSVATDTADDLTQSLVPTDNVDFNITKNKECTEVFENNTEINLATIDSSSVELTSDEDDKQFILSPKAIIQRINSLEKEDIVVSPCCNSEELQMKLLREDDIPVDLKKYTTIKPILLSVEEEVKSGVKEFDLASTVLSKKKTQVKLQDFKECKYCNAKIPTGDMMKHLRVFSKYVCQICNLRICNKRKLIKHISNHTNPSYQCDSCFQVYTEGNVFELHQKKCSYTHDKPLAIRKKVQLKKKYKCKKCKSVYNSRKIYRYHKKRCCSVVINNKSKQKHCYICNKVFGSNNKLSKHMAFHKVLLEECLECGECFDAEDNGALHNCTGIPNMKYSDKNKAIRSKLKENKVQTNEKITKICKKPVYSYVDKKRNLTCFKCIRGFKSNSQYADHIDTGKCLIMKNSKKCLLCKKDFIYSKELQKHAIFCFKESLTSLVKPRSKTQKLSPNSNNRVVYHCSRCSLLFPSLYTLRCHRKLKHGAVSKYQLKQHQCVKCRFRCFSRSLFHKHVKEDLCPKFTSFSCFLCNDNRTIYPWFGSLAKLLQHLNNHHDRVEEKSIPIQKLEAVRITNDSGKVKLLNINPKDILLLKDKLGMCNVSGFGMYELKLHDEFPLPYLTATRLPESSQSGKASPILNENVENCPGISSNKKITCFKCHELFTNNKEVIVHFRLVHKYRFIKLSLCPNCNMAFKDHRKYSLHHEKCTGITTLISTENDEERPQDDVLNLCNCGDCRAKPHSSKKQLDTLKMLCYCSKCKCHFSCRHHLNIHNGLTHPSANVFLCDICDVPFLKFSLLYQHYKEAHMISEKTISNDMVTLFAMGPRCSLCKTVFKDIAWHIHSHCNVMYECYCCNVKVSNKQLLINHITSIHKRNWTLADEKWTLKLQKENAQHVLQDMYLKKKVITSNQRDGGSQCYKCKYLFFHPLTLNRHISTESCFNNTTMKTTSSSLEVIDDDLQSDDDDGSDYDTESVEDDEEFFGENISSKLSNEIPDKISTITSELGKLEFLNSTISNQRQKLQPNNRLESAPNIEKIEKTVNHFTDNFKEVSYNNDAGSCVSLISRKAAVTSSSNTSSIKTGVSVSPAETVLVPISYNTNYHNGVRKSTGIKPSSGANLSSTEIVPVPTSSKTNSHKGVNESTGVKMGSDKNLSSIETVPVPTSSKTNSHNGVRKSTGIKASSGANLSSTETVPVPTSSKTNKNKGFSKSTGIKTSSDANLSPRETAPVVATPKTTHVSSSSTKKQSSVENLANMLKCGQCDELFSSERALFTHIKCNHLKVECPSCAALFTSSTSCFEHLINSHCYGDGYKKQPHETSLKHFKSTSKLRECPNCYLLFYEDVSFYKHLFTHFDITMETCYICNTSFSSIESLKDHYRATHQAFFCMCCYKTFHTFADLNSHSQLHVIECHIPRDDKSKMVIQIDPNPLESNKHLMLFPSIHYSPSFYMTKQVPKSFIEDQRLFYCYVCEKNIEGELTFIVHMKTHDEPRLLSCILCRRRFAELNELQNHFATHFDKRNEVKHDSIDEIIQLPRHYCNSTNSFKCEICLQVFDDLEALTQHEVEYDKAPSFKEEHHEYSTLVRQYCLKKKKTDASHYKSWQADWLVARKYDLDKIYNYYSIVKNKMLHPSVINVDKNLSTYICQFCYISLSLSEVGKHLRKHLHSFSNCKAANCAKCDGTVMRNDFYEHMSSKHKIKPPPSKLQTCQFCYVTLNHYEVEGHMLKHQQDLPVFSPYMHCSFCNMLLWKERIVDHMIKFTKGGGYTDSNIETSNAEDYADTPSCNREILPAVEPSQGDSSEKGNLNKASLVHKKSVEEQMESKNVSAKTTKVIKTKPHKKVKATKFNAPKAPKIKNDSKKKIKSSKKTATVKTKVDTQVLSSVGVTPNTFLESSEKDFQSDNVSMINKSRENNTDSLTQQEGIMDSEAIYKLLFDSKAKTCALCNLRVNTLFQLKRHLVEHFQHPQLVLDGSSRYAMCIYCKQPMHMSSIRRHVLIKHKKEHTQVISTFSISTPDFKKANMKREKKIKTAQLSKKVSSSNSKKAINLLKKEHALLSGELSKKDTSTYSKRAINDAPQSEPVIPQNELVPPQSEPDPTQSEPVDLSNSSKGIPVGHTTISDPVPAMPYPINCIVCCRGFFTPLPYLNHCEIKHPLYYEQEKVKYEKKTYKKGNKQGYIQENNIKISRRKSNPPKHKLEAFNEMKAKVAKKNAAKKAKNTTDLTQIKSPGRKIVRPGHPPLSFKFDETRNKEDTSPPKAKIRKLDIESEVLTQQVTTPTKRDRSKFQAMINTLKSKSRKAAEVNETSKSPLETKLDGALQNSCNLQTACESTVSENVTSVSNTSENHLITIEEPDSPAEELKENSVIEEITTEEEIIESSDENEIFVCNQCNSSFETQLKLDSHVNAVHQSDKGKKFKVPFDFVCLFCGHGLNKAVHLKKHLLSKHASLYTQDLEKSAQFRGKSIAQSKEIISNPELIELPKRDRTKFKEMISNLTSSRTKKTTKELDNEESTNTVSISPDKPLRISGRKRSINHNVKELLKKTKSTTRITTPVKKKPKQAVKQSKKPVDNVSKIEEWEESSSEEYDDHVTKAESNNSSDLKSSEEDQTGEEDEVNSDSDDDDSTASSEENKSHVCKYCDIVHKSYSKLRKHEKLHFADLSRTSNQLRCTCCNEMIVRHKLKWHMHREHANYSLVVLSRAKIYCPKCTYATKLSKHMNEHILESHPELLKIECRLCDERFLTQTIYMKHFENTHEKNIDESSLMCFLCNKTFESLPELYKHYSIIHMKKNENFHCLLCCKYFYGQEDFDKHENEYHKNDKFQCGLCFVEFTDAMLCEVHVLVHKAKSQYQCTVCSFYFQSDSMLKQHSKSHNSKCSNCEETFSLNEALEKLRKMKCKKALVNPNESLKTYKCSSCNESFNDIIDVREHMRVIHQGGTKQPTDGITTTGKSDDEYITQLHNNNEV